MMTVFLNDDILKEKIGAFFEFLSEISDNFVLSREFSGKLPKSLFDKVNNDLRSEINKDDSARREKYKKDEKFARELKQIYGISTKKQALKYFDDCKKQDMKAINASRKLTDDKQFTSENENILDISYSKETAVRRGPLFEIVSIKNSEELKKLTKGMEDIYTTPYTFEGTDFEDIAFYKDGEVKAGICTAERFCLLQLSKDELSQFLSLKLTHELN